MSETYTQGRWWVAYGQVWAGNGIDKQISILKADRDEPRTSPVERDANIVLASLAPELLEALNACVVALAPDSEHYLDSLDPEFKTSHIAYQQAKAAISKASA